VRWSRFGKDSAKRPLTQRVCQKFRKAKIRPLRQIRLLLVILYLGILEIGRILDYEWMHRKFARADQLKKVRIYTHLYRRNAEIAGFSRNIYEPWMENR
jgi:hypothetical protein